MHWFYMAFGAAVWHRGSTKIWYTLVWSLLIVVTKSCFLGTFMNILIYHWIEKCRCNYCHSAWETSGALWYPSEVLFRMLSERYSTAEISSWFILDLVMLLVLWFASCDVLSSLLFWSSVVTTYFEWHLQKGFWVSYATCSINTLYWYLELEA